MRIKSEQEKQAARRAAKVARMALRLERSGADYEQAKRFCGALQEGAEISGLCDRVGHLIAIGGTSAEARQAVAALRSINNSALAKALGSASPELREAIARAIREPIKSAN
jgi:hypothetical protein